MDLSSGNLTVVLEPFNCFDAEIYADELKLDEPIDFREDQRSMETIPGLLTLIPANAMYSQPWKVDPEISLFELN